MSGQSVSRILNMATVESESKAEAIATTYNWSILVPRWGATWLDFILFGLSFFAISLLPKSIVSWGVSLWFFVVLAYYPFLEFQFGATLGKFLCRIRVVNGDCKRPSIAQTLLRTLIRLFEVNPFLLGGIPAGVALLVSKKRQRLGDMAAGTFVLRVRDIPPAVSIANPP
jgi:uncharacterized RDD family membrane protein YckC